MKKIFTFLFLIINFYAFAYNIFDTSNAQFLADKKIIVKQATDVGYRLDDTVTRAEALGIALKIKGITLPSYQCKGYFSDVSNNDWVCRAVEIAADYNLVTKNNKNFRPQDTITRAEVLAIFMSAANIKIDEEQCQKWKSSITDTNTWQSCVFVTAHQKHLVEPTSSGGIPTYVGFSPDVVLKRHEVFDIGARILRLKEGKLPDLPFELTNSENLYRKYYKSIFLPYKLLSGYVGPDDKIVYLSDSFPSQTTDFFAFAGDKGSNKIYISGVVDNCIADKNPPCTKFINNFYEYDTVKHTWKVIFSEDTTEKSPEYEYYYGSMYRFIYTEGSKGIMYKIGVDSSPGPCFDPIVENNNNIFMFDFKNISAGMQKFSIPKNILDKHISEQESCSRDIFGS